MLVHRHLCLGKDCCCFLAGGACRTRWLFGQHVWAFRGAERWQTGQPGAHASTVARGTCRSEPRSCGHHPLASQAVLLLAPAAQLRLHILGPSTQRAPGAGLGSNIVPGRPPDPHRPKRRRHRGGGDHRHRMVDDPTSSPCAGGSEIAMWACPGTPPGHLAAPKPKARLSMSARKRIAAGCGDDDDHDDDAFYPSPKRLLPASASPPMTMPKAGPV